VVLTDSVGRQRRRRRSRSTSLLPSSAAARGFHRRRRVNPRAAHCFCDPEAFQHCSRGCTVPDSILGAVFVILNCLM